MRRGLRGGFTLLEVLVAAVVASVALGLVAVVLGRAAAGAGRRRSLEEAIAFVRVLELATTLDAAVPEEVSVGGVRWRVRVAQDDPRADWLLLEGIPPAGRPVSCPVPRKIVRTENTHLPDS